MSEPARYSVAVVESDPEVVVVETPTALVGAFTVAGVPASGGDYPAAAVASALAAYLPGGVASLPTARTLTVATAGQTVFSLPTAPANAAGLLLLVNGGSYAGPANLTVSGSILTWVNPSFRLTPADEVTALYA